MFVVLLSACSRDRFKPSVAVLPDVVEYSREIQSQAAGEMSIPQCHTLSNVMMPDYQVMRDQTRAARRLLK